MSVDGKGVHRRLRSVSCRGPGGSPQSQAIQYRGQDSAGNDTRSALIADTKTTVIGPFGPGGRIRALPPWNSTGERNNFEPWEAKGEAGTMAMHGRRPRKILQNRAELLTYETVSEALHVATRLAQSDEHGQFVIRMSQCVGALSDSGRCVLERIARCGEGHVRSTAEGRYKVERTRCGYPVCPTCGIKARDRVASKLRVLVDETKSSYGFDAVSFITVNSAPCRLNEVAIKVEQFRTSLRNIIRRRCPQVSLIGEFEVIQESEPMSYRVGTKGVEKISKVGEGSETTHPGIEMTWIRLHLHAMAVHPGLTRQKLQRILRLVFDRKKAVRDRRNPGS